MTLVTDVPNSTSIVRDVIRRSATEFFEAAFFEGKTLYQSTSYTCLGSSSASLDYTMVEAGRDVVVFGDIALLGEPKKEYVFENLLGEAFNVSPTGQRLAIAVHDPVRMHGKFAFVTLALPKQPIQPTATYVLFEANVTSPLRHTPEVEAEVISCLARVEVEELENGMTLALGTQVATLVEKYGDSAINVLSSVISSGKVVPDVASHVLRWLGRINHPQSIQRRLWILMYSLRSPFSEIRDGAALGLASLGNPLAIPSLRAAIHHERFRALRRSMEAILRQLEAKQGAASV